MTYTPLQIAWVDNNSGPEALEVYGEFELERVALHRINYGITDGINALLFDLCKYGQSLFCFASPRSTLDLNPKSDTPNP